MATPVSNSVARSGHAYIDGLVQGSSWSFGGSRVLTYSLHEDLGWFADPVVAWKAAAAWSAVANINFRYIGKTGFIENSPADIAVLATGTYLQSNFGALGIGIFPDPNYVNFVFSQFRSAGINVSRSNYPKPEGDIFIDTLAEAWNNGGVDFWTALHELGHALGLKHPHDGGFNGRPTFNQLGINNVDNQKYTLMSYKEWKGNDISDLFNGFSATPMPLDILAIQRIYGANWKYHTGNDTYILKENGVVKTIWDAGGIDTINASKITEGIEIRLNPGFFIEHGDQSLTAIAFKVRIENATGSQQNDLIVGNSVSNKIYGLKGNDNIYGISGNDVLIGNGGDDQIIGGNGNDYLYGGKDSDTLLGGNNNDFLFGGTGNDTLKGQAGSDRLEGGAGSDLLKGGNQLDIIIGGTGNDELKGGSGNDRLYGGGGNDTLVGGVGNDYLYGGKGEDTLYGRAGDDFLYGGDGNDILDGRSGSDVLEGGAGADTFYIDADDTVLDYNPGEGDQIIESSVSAAILAISNQSEAVNDEPIQSDLILF